MSRFVKPTNLPKEIGTVWDLYDWLGDTDSQGNIRIQLPDNSSPVAFSAVFTDGGQVVLYPLPPVGQVWDVDKNKIGWRAPKPPAPGRP